MNETTFHGISSNEQRQIAALRDEAELFRRQIAELSEQLETQKAEVAKLRASLASRSRTMLFDRARVTELLRTALKLIAEARSREAADLLRAELGMTGSKEITPLQAAIREAARAGMESTLSRHE